MRRQGRQGRRHHRGLWLIVAVGTLVIFGIVFRLVLDPIAAHYTRKALNEGEAVRGTFSGVHVTLLPPGYEIRRLKVIAYPGGSWDRPLMYVERAQISLLWRELLSRHVVARADLDHPKFIVIKQPEEKAKEKKPPPELWRVLDKLLPAKLDRFTVRDGELLVVQGQDGEAGELWLHRMELVAENLATRKALMEGEPSKLRLDATVQRTGKLAVDASMNPLAKKVSFSAKAALRHLSLRELYSFLAPATKMEADQGKIDVFVDLRARDGVLSGGVKPVLTDAELKSVDRGLFARIKATLADAAVDLLEDERGEHDVAATTVPIKGHIDDPHAQVVPAVLGAVRNAMVVGLSSGFTNLPPATAGEKQDVVRQAWKALKPSEGPPKAEPEPGDEKRTEPRKGRAPTPAPERKRPEK